MHIKTHNGCTTVNNGWAKQLSAQEISWISGGQSEVNKSDGDWMYIFLLGKGIVCITIGVGLVFAAYKNYRDSVDYRNSKRTGTLNANFRTPLIISPTP